MESVWHENGKGEMQLEGLYPGIATSVRRDGFGYTFGVFMTTLSPQQGEGGRKDYGPFSVAAMPEEGHKVKYWPTLSEAMKLAESLSIQPYLLEKAGIIFSKELN